MTATPPPPPAPPSPGSDNGWNGFSRDLGQLRRSRQDRKIAGVAAGIARHFDIDPLVVRIALVVLVFFGGGGIVLYGAGWLLLPEEGEDTGMVRLDDRSRSVALTIAGVLAALSVVGDTVGGWDFPWPLGIGAAVVIAVLASKRQRRQQFWDHMGQVHHGHRPPPPAGTPGAAYAAYQPGPGEPEPTPATAAFDPKAYTKAYTDMRVEAATRKAIDRQRARWERRMARRKRGPILFGFTLLLAALATGVIGTLQLTGVDITPAAYPAAVLASVGLMLVVGSFWGRAGGLIFLGLVAALATVVVTTTVQYGNRFDIGEVHRTPHTADEVLTGDFGIGLGEVRLDLTELSDAELERLNGKTIEMNSGIGSVRVIVPKEGLDVQVDANVDAGSITLFGDESDNDLSRDHDGGPDAPRLTISSDLTFGEIRVETDERPNHD